jgi:O-acetyl-ADP-ribose deacetylase
MIIEIVKGNIIDCDTEAIVNAANTNLYAGGGVCGAIFEAAGYKKMEEACKKIGHCDTGNAVITCGFNLKSKYVIHAVGPMYIDDIEENVKITNSQLYYAYINSLILAEENGIKSIAFPIISAGIYGYPLPKALEIEKNAINDYFKNHDNSCIEKIVICAYTAEIYNALIKMYNKNDI